MELCKCGSGFNANECHRGMNPSEIRRQYQHAMLLKGKSFNSYQLFSDKGDFEKSKYSGVLRLNLSNTPAGLIFYPLMIRSGKSALRPLTIDGYHTLADNNNRNVLLQCMITPIHFANIVFNLNNALPDSKVVGVYEVPCAILTSGRPFESVFALESTKNRVALYHHTTDENLQKIKDSKMLYGSRWNIQGTAERHDYHHIYFTDIPKIEDERDLWSIAMCDRGTNLLVVTDKNEKAQIEVYRENPTNRPSTLKVWVPYDFLVPNHLILHSEGAHLQSGNFGATHSWWEVFNTSIYRVAVKPKTALPLSYNGLKNQYYLLGDNNLERVHKFKGVLGEDLEGLMSIWAEKPIKRRGGKTYPSDYGDVDDEWVKVWSRNLSEVSLEVLHNVIQPMANKKLE